MLLILLYTMRVTMHITHEQMKELMTIYTIVKHKISEG
jgi:hypothetical protein